ncbi:MAG: hypothetical protein ACXWQR_11535, partial [Ktedonobacterales bacterium]
ARDVGVAVGVDVTVAVGWVVGGVAGVESMLELQPDTNTVRNPRQMSRDNLCIRAFLMKSR